jgi:hypothetical protein
MPTTTNNGWTIPADTDLVKNGAAAIRTLGNAIDTTLGVYAPSGMTQLGTATLSGTSTVISSISQAYKTLIVVVKNANISSSGYFLLRPNSSGSTRAWQGRVVGTSYATNSGTDLSLDAGELLKSANTTNVTVAYFPFYAATDSYKLFTNQTAFLTNASARFQGFTSGVYEDNTAISSIQLFAQNSMSGGTMTVYGAN